MNARTEPAVLVPVRLGSPTARTTTVTPYGFPMVCQYEYDPGEAPRIGSLEFAHPGYPATVSLLSCRINECEVYDMLSPQQVETIEEAILDQLEN